MLRRFQMGMLAAIGLAASGCVLDVESEVADPAPAQIEDGTVGSLPAPDSGPAPPCGADLVIGADGTLVQEPVLCDPFAEVLPDTELVRDPYETLHEPTDGIIQPLDQP